MTISLSLVIARSEFSERMLHLSLFPMAIVTISMTITSLATVTWTALIYSKAPEFARSSNGLGQGNVPWLVAALGAMLFASVVALFSLKQGLNARRIVVV